MIEWKAPDGKRSARKQGSPEQETGCGEAAKAREKGVYYLQFSSKTEEEMRRKLAEQGFSPASVDSAVKFLKERRYLNDEDYARRYLEKNGKKKSRKQLQYELSRKGISREILELVFEEIPGDEREQILEILRKRQFPLDGGELEEKKKICAYLARRGYSWDDINAALDHYARKETV